MTSLTQRATRPCPRGWQRLSGDTTTLYQAYLLCIYVIHSLSLSLTHTHTHTHTRDSGSRHKMRTISKVLSPEKLRSWRLSQVMKLRVSHVQHCLIFACTLLLSLSLHCRHGLVRTAVSLSSVINALSGSLSR